MFMRVVIVVRMRVPVARIRVVQSLVRMRLGMGVLVHMAMLVAMRVAVRMSVHEIAVPVLMAMLMRVFVRMPVHVRMAVRLVVTMAVRIVRVVHGTSFGLANLSP